MDDSLKALLARTAPTLAEDCVGVAALIVLLLVGLHLPALV